MVEEVRNRERNGVANNVETVAISKISSALRCVLENAVQDVPHQERPLQ